MKILCILTLTITFILTSCNSDGRRHFSLTIKHFAGAAGLTLIYTINENDLQIATNCDLENCKQKTVYKRTFTKNESDSIFNFITSIQLDTLKPKYETKNMLDGLFTKITISKGFLSSHTSTFDNFSTPTTDTLFNYIDNLVLIKKYRFHNWGDE